MRRSADASRLALSPVAAWRLLAGPRAACRRSAGARALAFGGGAGASARRGGDRRREAARPPRPSLSGILPGHPRRRRQPRRHCGDRLALAAGADADRLSVVAGRPLPAGWTGKLWALQQGLESVAATAPATDWLLFTDADIRHGPGQLERLVRQAEARGGHLVSLMVRLRCESRWERLLIPAFVYFFQKLYPFAWIADPRRRTAGAAGGCVLVRRDRLEVLGGFAAIRNRLID